MTITINNVRNYHMRTEMHLNFGGGSFGYDFTCVENERFTQQYRSIKPRGKKPGQRTNVFLVDGWPAEDLEDVTKRLNEPPRTPPPEVLARQTALAEARERARQRREAKNASIT